MIKKLWQSILDIVLILLLVIFAQIIPQIILGLPQIFAPGLKTNHSYILVADTFLSLGYLWFFYAGFKWLSNHRYHHKFSTISGPVRLKKHYFTDACLLIAILLAGTWLLGVKVATPSLNHWEFMQNLINNVLLFFVAPLVEEIAFRGVIIEQVARRSNTVTGVIVSSLLFGLVHLMNGQLDLLSAIQLVVSGFLMGTLLSLAYLWAHSIWANFTLHAAYNLILTLIPVQASLSHDWPFQLIFTSHHQLMTGGQYGSDCSLPFNLAYLVMIGLFWIRFRSVSQKTPL
ncbi:CPBP family intramembrane glutamic endopeptidase [Limosilactobacillus gastricus]|uniref:CPBP family intramembrane glutamic endopeptidase n=1 Tax=Limosilactobacillus gastricus TaxID=227942 RepID=UPI0026F214E2|nr:CPBP family intramembrane glutamic endopeptidase [Limosilactobacillus gastricus]